MFHNIQTIFLRILSIYNPSLFPSLSLKCYHRPTLTIWRSPQCSSLPTTSWFQKVKVLYYIFHCLSLSSFHTSFIKKPTNKLHEPCSYTCCKALSSGKWVYFESVNPLLNMSNQPFFFQRNDWGSLRVPVPRRERRRGISVTLKLGMGDANPSPP